MKKNNIIKVILTILVVFLCFFSNYFLSWLFDTISFLKNSSQSIILIVDIILKILACWLLFTKLINKDKTKQNRKISISQLSMVLILVILVFVALFDIFSDNGIRLFFEIKNYNLSYLMLRTIYNVLYVLDMVLFVEYVDEIMLEHKDTNKNIPYGGIVLGIIRAIPCLITANYIMSVRALILSALVGVVYILSNRNRNLSYVINLIMFYL